MNNMKLLDRGWQYSVYDLGNGRVLKRYNTWCQAYGVMLRDALSNMRFPVVCFTRYYREGKQSAVRSLTSVRESSLDQKLFGNPRVISGHTYEQDFAEPLSKYLKQISDEEGRIVIDRFVSLSAFLVSNSLIEKNFNIGDNFGRTALGEIVLTDLGELCTDPSEVAKQIRSRVWAAPDVVRQLPPALRTYFVEQMDRAFVKK
jgi:hypothetical protein